MPEMYRLNLPRCKASAHTPRRKKVIALLNYYYGGSPFAKGEAKFRIQESGETEGSSFENIWGDLTSTGFVESI